MISGRSDSSVTLANGGTNTYQNVRVRHLRLHETDFSKFSSDIVSVVSRVLVDITFNEKYGAVIIECDATTLPARRTTSLGTLWKFLLVRVSSTDRWAIEGSSQQMHCCRRCCSL